MSRIDRYLVIGVIVSGPLFGFAAARVYYTIPRAAFAGPCTLRVLPGGVLEHVETRGVAIVADTDDYRMANNHFDISAPGASFCAGKICSGAWTAP